MTTQTTRQTTQQRTRKTPPIVRRGSVVAAAVVLAVVVRWLLGALAGIDFTVRAGSGGPAHPVGIGSVAAVALGAGLLAWGSWPSSSGRPGAAG
jgi:uncharacterized protein DUF6069